jgi:hypothetical protein
MTAPLRYRDYYVPIKWFLTSYKAVLDGKKGIDLLDNHLKENGFSLSEWKVIWVGSCSLLRTSIDLFKNADLKTCIDSKIKKEIKTEWDLIGKNKDKHKIFWEFLQKERNNILHQYEWAAYEAWMDKEGAARPATITLLGVQPDEVENVLIMRGGAYNGRNSVDLLRESADWAEERIFSAIRRAGFDPDEERNAVTFKSRPPNDAGIGL